MNTGIGLPQVVVGNSFFAANSSALNPIPTNVSQVDDQKGRISCAV